MTPDQLQVLLHEEGDVEVGPAPITRIAAAARRRRARTVVAATVAAVLVIAGGGVVLQHLGRADATAVGRPVPNGPLEPPPGTRYVGMNGVVVLVPKAWGVGGLSGLPCPPVGGGAVTVPPDGLEDSRPCPAGTSEATSSLWVYDFDSFGGSEILKHLHPGSPAGSEEVLENELACTTLGCAQTFAVPSKHALFTINAELGPGRSGALVRAVRLSVRILTEGETTVPLTLDYGQQPYIPGPGSGREVGELEDAIRAAGLEVAIARFPSPRYRTGTFGGTNPGLGTPVEVGSTVTIRLSVRPGPQVVVPDLTGLLVGAARARLTAIGLRAHVRSGNRLACVPVGRVVAQVPGPSGRVEPGGFVQLVVNGSSSARCGLDLAPTTPALAEVGREFVAFARRDRNSAPFANTVALFLGSSPTATFDRASADRRQTWLRCPHGHGYAERTCPISVLKQLADGYPGPIAFTSATPAAPCDAPRPPPASLDRYQRVTLLADESQSCFDYFSVELFLNDRDRIVAVNLLLGSP